MSAFGAFARGVAGQGLMQLGSDMQSRDRLAQELQAREREAEEQRRFRAEQAAQDRALREELAAQRATGGRSGARGALDPEAAAQGQDDYVAARLAQEKGVSLPEAQAMIQAFKSGQNPYTNEVVTNDSDLSGMDRRLGAGKATKQQPDVERFKELMSKVGGYYARAKADTSGKAQDLANSEQTRWETGSGQAAQNPNATPAQVNALGRGTAIAKGTAPFSGDGDNVLTGQPGALTSEKIKSEKALQADRGASAGQHKAAAEKLIAETSGDLKKQTPEKLTSAINAITPLIKSMEGSMDPEDEGRRKQLQSLAMRLSSEIDRRSLGGAPGADKPDKPVKGAPYPDGTRLKGPGGKPYIVRNGVPVPL